ncbi:serine/threonine protein kinase [Singulisphaera acidiphila DSM 18658]|uniref:Nicotinamidase n=1 Tax=Singulisphaera acidiphila (strain ATCC BAA-1392 / DSM 18658 / VKM B-2454 / MOB10) TaxID=886293 RepID=L0DGN6_SINAD|nr:bifunctional nicotinamidase/pyrazinamidase [Singulisphaera acidiphila]AGA27836.1 serine/threonine protein kinase [Singulisphaera acidiphila DSM 18658]
MSDDPYLQLTNVGHCRILSRLGEGGMGVVYKGHHTDLDLDVAVKFLHPQRVQAAEGPERFLREARLAARLNHPGIVRVFDCGESEGHYYIVMEFVDGQSLADHIEERKAMPVARALQIAEAVARALGTAFDQIGVIHRDIKPANILLTTAGAVKVADLGLAKIVADLDATVAYTSAGIALGTPSYMSPEQFDDASQVDLRADIFSLGATLYHMLSGEMPFKGTSLFRILKQVQEADPAPLPSSVPGSVGAIVARMMAKRPEDRFQTYTELIEALSGAQRSLGDDTLISTRTLLKPVTSVTTIPAAKLTGRTIRAASPTENRALLVVDVQNDFCPHGALAVPEGDLVVPIINKLSRRFAHVILTQDWHCDDHLSFASSHPGSKPMSQIELHYGLQILWPDHCVQGTPGAQFHPDLDLDRCEMIIRKGYHRDIDSYSAFFENDRQTPTGLAGYLRERGLTRLFIVGLATDFCVAYSAIDACRLGFEVTVIENACRGIDVDGSLAASWRQMAEAGVIRA